MYELGWVISSCIAGGAYGFGVWDSVESSAQKFYLSLLNPGSECCHLQPSWRCAIVVCGLLRETDLVGTSEE
jgi:hypothetical protein